MLRPLTEEQMEARARALGDAREREEEDRRRAEIEAKARAEREAAERAEREAAEARKREEESRRQQEVAAKKRAEEEARRRLGGETRAPEAAALRSSVPLRRPRLPPHGLQRRALRLLRQTSTTDARPAARRIITPPAKLVVPPRPAAPRTGELKNRGRLTVTSATAEEEERTRSVASFRRRVQRLKGMNTGAAKEKIQREVVLPETITIQELANRMSERGVDVIRLLMKQGQMLKITDVIDADTAQLIAEEMGHTVKRVAESDVEEGLFDTPDLDEHLEARPPVVTIMGHVDHGKTSLLDALRSANVVAGEAGGITQHIGAYQVTAPSGQLITFIDTPGHAAFTAMRARGAKVTDIVVLVVAADDGVMPQTIEAINHARAAKVPLIVAINKIDKADAKPERVRTELLQHEVQVESMGGETLEVEVSATKKINLDKLLDAISLQAEVLDLKANPDRGGEGTVIEARLDRGRGPVATVLVQRGTLRTGDIIVAGSQWGRVRALIDDKGGNITSAGPSAPAEVLGFSGAPEAGDRVAVVESEARAREVTEYRDRQKREKAAARGAGARGSLIDMMSQLKTAAARNSRCSSRATFRARWRRFWLRWKSLARKKLALELSTQVSAVYPNPTSRWPKPRALRSSASMCVRIRKPATLQIVLASKSATTTSSTISWMTLRRRCPLARSHAARGNARQRGNLGSVQHLQGRQGCRLPRYRRARGEGRQRASHSRQRRRSRRQAFNAQALQGRGQGSRGRTGMRHGFRELPGHAPGRRHRMLPCGEHQAVLVIAFFLNPMANVRGL